ncbi:MAG TPA: ribosome assembly RNA-binding protein YhbY [Veillonellaceae bacterium]|nr:ribosome assembly RNA-binding protein YhbY [Veillonellaceae bacterium]
MLTSKQKQYLKALASKMPAVLQIGKEGNTESVLKSAEDALLARELIKVKINQNSDEDIKETASYIADKLQCDVVQVIGRTCILFKQKEKKSHYELP